MTETTKPADQAAQTEKLVEATAGPYRGQRLTLPIADADQAVKDGWAKDPFAAPPTDEELAEAKLPTEEERLKVEEAAAKAARKLRGEEEPAAEKPAAKPAPAPHDPGANRSRRL